MKPSDWKVSLLNTARLSKDVIQYVPKGRDCCGQSLADSRLAGVEKLC